MSFHRSIMLCVACLVCTFVSAFAQGAPKVTTSEKGVHISNGTMGGFVMDYPLLQDAKQKKVHPLTEKKASGDSATIKYEGGATLKITIEGDDVKYAFSGMPDDVKTIKHNMLLSYEVLVDGNWSVNEQDAKPFPREKPAKPHLFQGPAKSVKLTSQQGQSISLALPPYTFLQLTDNREWGWKIYNFQGTVPFNKDAPSYSMKIGAGGENVKPKVIVDKFGQTVEEFPDKVHSEEELKADVEKEIAYYASLNPPAFDAYGGQPGSGEKLGLKKTGFFHVEKAGASDKRRWYLVNPDGNAFFHLGVCCFGPGYPYTYIKGRENIYEWLPPDEDPWKTAFQPGTGRDIISFHLVNQIRKYGKPIDNDEFATRMIDRVRKIGFNSGGAFGSPTKKAREAASFPYVSTLPLGKWSGGLTEIPGVRETFDPFNEKNRKLIDEKFSKSLPPNANDPLLIGYFLANEPLYEYLPRVIPTLDSKWACKVKLVEFLKERHKTIDAFNDAWKENAKSFEELADKGLAVKTPVASEDVNAFVGLFLETYFQLIHDTFRKYDQNHMLIGNRLQSGTINNEQLCRISAKYLDVISFNYYTYALDTDFLKRINGWTDKPMFLSEFYWNSPSDSGVTGGVKDVSSQDERGLAYRNYVEQAASLDFVVGVEWFTLIDASPTGVAYAKYNGERPNSGLFSNADRPWKQMIAHMVKTNYDIYALVGREKPAFVYDDPKFVKSANAKRVVTIPRATGAIALDGGSTNWPGTPAEQIPTTRLVQGAASNGVEAAFKLCWDEDNLYVMANVTDATPMKNANKPEDLWQGDGLELFIGAEKLDEGGALLFGDRQVLLGAGAESRFHIGRAPKDEPVECEVVTKPNVDGKGYTLMAKIPFKSLGFKPQEGQSVRFDLAVDDSRDGSTRSAQLMWNGVSRNSGDRTAWGVARFVK